jgi:hypothetical protein
MSFWTIFFGVLALLFLRAVWRICRQHRRDTAERNRRVADNLDAYHRSVDGLPFPVPTAKDERALKVIGGPAHGLLVTCSKSDLIRCHNRLRVLHVIDGEELAQDCEVVGDLAIYADPEEGGRD